MDLMTARKDGFRGVDYMSLNSAVAGFGVLSQKYNLKFCIPYVCNGIYFGQEQSEVFDNMKQCSKRDCSIVFGNGGKVSVSDVSGVYLVLDFSGRKLSGITFSGISDQIPAELRYCVGRNTYCSTFIVDDHMIWIKSDSEIKVKSVSGIQGNAVSSKDLGVVVSKGLKRSDCEKVLNSARSLSGKKGENYNTDLYNTNNRGKLEGLVQRERDLAQKLRNLNYEFGEIDKKLSYHDGVVNQFGDRYNTVKKNHQELVDSLEKMVRKYGNASLYELIRYGYLIKNSDGTVSIVRSAKKPDERRPVRRTKTVKRLGQGDFHETTFAENNTWYHYEEVEYTDYETVRDKLYEQCAHFMYCCEDIMNDIHMLYESMCILKTQYDTASVNKNAFDNLTRNQLIYRKRDLGNEIQKLQLELKKVKEELYAS